MFNTREAVKNIHWVGGSDRRLALFENLFPVPRGVSYNSFLILDEKTALIDTVDSSIRQQFTDNVKGVPAASWIIWSLTTWSRTTAPASRILCCATPR